MMKQPSVSLGKSLNYPNKFTAKNIIDAMEQFQYFYQI